MQSAMLALQVLYQVQSATFPEQVMYQVPARLQHTQGQLSSAQGDEYQLREMCRVPRRGLTPEERARLMRENRCFRCKQVGHMARNCTENHPNAGRPQVSQRARLLAELGVLKVETPKVREKPNYGLNLLITQVYVAGQPERCLIDSGATRNFASQA